MGAIAQHVASVGALKAALIKARQNTRTTVLVIDTTAHETTQDGGCWWEVAVPEVSERDEVRRAREAYLHNKTLQKV